MLTSVLVANRGEIAVRVMRTCSRLGMRTIAIYSEADARGLHTLAADEAYPIGPPPAAESYLDRGAILDVARRSGAQAIHPGYGFLAENADFAQACLDAGLVWIGPPPAAMRALGDKSRARALAEQIGVPVLPGYHGERQEPDELADQAATIGYPVLIKASAGGGGRGMRVVERPDQFADQLQAARREALASFGDTRVLLERYVSRPRHVEVQVFGDQHGNLIHLGERECSVQRRHQKLIEESPSPAVDADLRARMGEAALKLARAADYRDAGTVEFLLDEQRAFYFLEVNARLQVEHPVTELVTGLDLVELQLRVAAGEPLPLTQANVRLAGHAIEARIIAEDPVAGFLPSVGTLAAFAPAPAPSTPEVTLRHDVGFCKGATVSPHYDSLLAKSIVHGPSRTVAVGLLRDALAAWRVEGVQHNLDLLLAVVQHPAFRRGDLHTGFLAEHRVVESLAATPVEVVAAVAVCALQVEPPGGDPWRATSGWRVARLAQPSVWDIAGQRVEATVSATPGSAAWLVRVGNQAVQAEWLGRDATADAERVRVGAGVATVRLAPVARVAWAGQTYRLRRPDPLQVVSTESAGGGTSGALSAPMPGRIVQVAVSEGEPVAANQRLLVLEAMKMEHAIDAPHAGLVSRLYVAPGQQVGRGDPLIELGQAREP